MYEIFYLAMLISAILAGIASLVTTSIGQRVARFGRCISYGLLGICVVSLIGFIVTTPML